METSLAESLRQRIREIPDFPKPGILFFDITTVLQDGKLFRRLIKALAERYQGVDAVVGIESRGFIFASPLAVELEVAFVPIRKPGKLPFRVESVSYLTEYSSDSVEIHRDALGPGHEVVIVDDLIATGGTAKGAAELVVRLGASVRECAFIIELSALGGQQKLAPFKSFSLLSY